MSKYYPKEMKIPGFAKKIYFNNIVRIKRGKYLFVPHAGFTNKDKASVINYKADNCLIFVRYLLDNELCLDKELVLISTTVENAQKEQAFCNKHYPKANIRIIAPETSRELKKEWASSEFIFESEPHFPYAKKKGQKYICLGYFPISLKLDYNEYQNSYYYHKEDIDSLVSTSHMNSLMDSAMLTLPYDRLKMVGKCRSDVLLKGEDVSFVRDSLQEQSSEYTFSKVLLYVPTHRDYEQSTFDIKRSILGFDVDKERFEAFLRENKLLIVCKLHPHQNAAVIRTELPKGVIIFEPQENFGLIELMKASDMLITDYTSAYIDYLLLDKPVVFNFYDLDLYQKTRGVSFYPYSRICAGEVFTDEDSFYAAISKSLKEPNKYKKDRQALIEEFLTVRTNVCQNTYQTIFNEK